MESCTRGFPCRHKHANVCNTPDNVAEPSGGGGWARKGGMIREGGSSFQKWTRMACLTQVRHRTKKQCIKRAAIRSHQYRELFIGDGGIESRTPTGMCISDSRWEKRICVCKCARVTPCMCVRVCSRTLQDRSREFNVHELLFSCTIS